MYFLLRIKLRHGERARCVVTHLRSGQDDEADTLEDRTVPEPDGPSDRERGWVIPANPQPGDKIRFEMVEVEPVGVDGAAYEWDVSFCEANGPAKMDDPRLFGVTVPAQTDVDILQCPDAQVREVRAVKDGARSFCWTVEPPAQVIPTH